MARGVEVGVVSVQQAERAELLGTSLAVLLLQPDACSCPPAAFMADLVAGQRHSGKCEKLWTVTISMAHLRHRQVSRYDAHQECRIDSVQRAGNRTTGCTSSCHHAL